MCKIIVFAVVIVCMLNLNGALKPECNAKEDLLQRCSMALPVLSSREMSFARTQGELNASCVELRSGIKCIDNFTTACMDKNEQVMFRNIYSGITGVVAELCTPGKYQEEYLKHATCVKDVREKYEECSQRYESQLTSLDPLNTNTKHQIGHDLNHEDSLRKVCCSFQEYLQCSEKTVRGICGDEAARFTSTFLTRMASNILKHFCMEYRDHECGSPNKATNTDHSVIMFSITVFVNVMAYMSDALVPT